METFSPTLAETDALLTAGLDYYKPTMSQLAYKHEPDTQVTFTLHNRGDQRFADYLEPGQLQERFDEIQARGWTRQETEFLGSIVVNDGQRAFSQNYQEYLRTHDLPPVEIGYDETSQDLFVETTGDWPMAMFWETQVMADVSEYFFENYLIAHDINPVDVYNEGDRRLSEKIAVLQAHPDIRIVDFGTRRRFSLKWHEHVLERLVEECPDSLVGTSNVALSQKFNLKPIGTFAHEMPMVYAALAEIRGQDVRESHNGFLEDWYNLYGEEYSIALTDTFGTDFFFEDFTAEQARKWRGVRQDSGDPFVFGEQLVKFYQELGINPKSKVLVFSDNLNFRKIVDLKQQFGDRINDLDGIGTNLTNDLGLTALNMVMKATRVRVAEASAFTVKLSDDKGKHTGPPESVALYEDKYFKVAA